MSDLPLLRNKSGTARDRDPNAPVDDLEFEAAIGRNVRQLRLAARPHRRGNGCAGGYFEGNAEQDRERPDLVQPVDARAARQGLRRARHHPVPRCRSRAARGVREGGHGARIVRNGTKEGHDYQLLGSLRGEHKRLECLHVTLSAKSKTYPLFQHPGTEFIFMLEGVMDYSHSRSVYRLEPGDSLQIDGEGAHGPVDLIEVPIRFLSVIAFPDSQV